MEEEKSLKQLIEELTKKVDDKDDKPKKRSFWIPMSAKVGKNKAKKGWATIMVIKENRNIDFVRQVSFSAGGFSGRFGDRVSSLTNISLRDGNEERFGGEINFSATVNNS
jgi:hypothetical protein